MTSSTRFFASLASLLLAAPIVGCMAELDEQDEFVAEESQALSAETCNGVDDDGDFMIDEGDVCEFDKYADDTHEYLVVQDQLDQATAQAMCRGRGMNLARIQDPSENAFLQPFVVGTQGFWIDLNDRAVEGSYRYEDGTAASWLNWSTYEPNNYNNEDCGMMWDTGKWNDLNCGWTNKTFCELLDPVEWDESSFDSVSREGTTLTKTDGQSWDAGAYSITTIQSGEGFVQFTTDEDTTAKAVGLTSDPAGTQWYSMDYAIMLTKVPGTNEPIIQIWENGGFSARSVNGTYAPGDVFRVEIVAGEVRYLRNGALMHSHATTPTYPLYADASLGGTAGTTVADVSMRACQGQANCIPRNAWTAATNALAVGNRVKKVSGMSWDAGAATIATVSSNGAYMRFKSPDSGAKKVGFSTPHTDFAQNNVQYGFEFKMISGVPHAVPLKPGGQNGNCSTVSYTPGVDTFQVELEGTTTVVYKKNGNAYCTYTATTAHPPLVSGDVILGTPESEVTDVSFGALQNTVNRTP